MIDVCGVLLSWAITLSGYANINEGCPTFEPKTHQWLIEQACDGRECPVFAWYPNSGGDVIYHDERMKPDTNVFHYSVWFHETVHWLQGQNGKIPAADCTAHMVNEREAYALQQKYIVTTGEPIVLPMPLIYCSNIAP